MSVSWKSTDTGLTASAPTTSDQGMDLTGLEAFRVILSCPSGVTFDLTTGTPKLLFYLWSWNVGRWMLNPNLTRALTTSDADGGRDIVIDDVPTFVPLGRVYVAQSGITVSSGSVIGGLVLEGWKP